MSRAGVYLVMGLLTAFLGVFLLWPLADTVLASVVDTRPDGGKTLTGVYLAELFRNPLERDAVLLSFWIACCTTVVSLALALPLAWLFARRSFFGKSLFSGLLLLPMVMPPFVGVMGMKMLFARHGAFTGLLWKLGITDQPVDWLGTFPVTGIVLLEALHLFPILYLNLAAALSNVDPSLENAAANLGATPWRVFRRVTLPLAMPGLFAGVTLVFVWSFTELGTPLMFGMRGVLPSRIFHNTTEIGTNPVGPAQVAFVLAVTALGFALGKRALRHGRETATAGRLAAGSAEKRLGPGATLAVWAGAGALVLLATLPHISVALLASTEHWRAGSWPEGWTTRFYTEALGQADTLNALRNSLMLSAAACVIDLFAGYGIAWLCVRKRARGSGLLDALAMLPLAAPGIVVAFGYLACFRGQSFPLIGHALNPDKNPMFLLAISYAIRRLPYMTRSAYAGLEQVSASYEEAAANAGARPWRVAWRITVPLISANLLAGGVLTFAFSMLEVSDSLILAQEKAYYPLTKQIYWLSAGLVNGPNLAAALGMWAMALLTAALLYVMVLLGRRAGQLFRVG